MIRMKGCGVGQRKERLEAAKGRRGKGNISRDKILIRQHVKEQKRAKLKESES